MADSSSANQGRITGKAGKSAGKTPCIRPSGKMLDKPRFIRPVERQRMRPWLIEHLDQNDIPGLVWQNRREKIFRIAWKHAANQCFNMQKDTNLFERWAFHTGRHYDSDHKRWKANFRCALNSLPDVIENKEQGIKKGNNAFKVYRFLDEKETKSVKEVKELKAGRRKKEVEDKLYQCQQILKFQSNLKTKQETPGKSGDSSEEEDDETDGSREHSYAESKDGVYVNNLPSGSGGTASIPKLDQLYGVDLLLEADSKDRLKPLKTIPESNLQEILAAATASLAAGSDAVSLEKISIEQLSRLGEVSRMKLDVQSSNKSDKLSGFMNVFLCGWCEKVFPSKVELFQHFLIFHQEKLMAGDEYGASMGPGPSDSKHQKLQREIEDLEKAVLDFTRQTSVNQSQDSSEVIEDGEVVDMSMDSKMTSQEMYVEDQALDLSVKPQRRTSAKQEMALDLSISTSKKQKIAPQKSGIKRRRGSLEIDYSVKFGNYGISGKPRTKRQLDLHLRKKEEEEEKMQKKSVEEDEETEELQHSVEDLVHAEILMSLKTGPQEETGTPETKIKPETGPTGAKVIKKDTGKGKKVKGMPKRHLQHLEKVIEDVAKKGDDDGDDDNDEVVVDDMDTSEKKPKKSEKVHCVKAFKCGLCLKKFESSDILFSHVQSHKSPYKCGKCEQDFGSKSALRSHVVTHTGTYEQHHFQCNLCSQYFINVKELKNHLLAHPDIFVNTCNICEEKFDSLAMQNKHVKEKHTKEEILKLLTENNGTNITDVDHGENNSEKQKSVGDGLTSNAENIVVANKLRDNETGKEGEMKMETDSNEVGNSGDGTVTKNKLERQLGSEVLKNLELCIKKRSSMSDIGKAQTEKTGETVTKPDEACSGDGGKVLLHSKIKVDKMPVKVDPIGDKSEQKSARNDSEKVTKECFVAIDRLKTKKLQTIDSKGDGKRNEHGEMEVKDREKKTNCELKNQKTNNEEKDTNTKMEIDGSREKKGTAEEDDSAQPHGKADRAEVKLKAIDDTVKTSITGKKTVPEKDSATGETEIKDELDKAETADKLMTMSKGAESQGDFVDGISVGSAAEVPYLLVKAVAEAPVVVDDSRSDGKSAVALNTETSKTFGFNVVRDTDVKKETILQGDKLYEDQQSKLPAFAEISSDVEDIVIKNQNDPIKDEDSSKSKTDVKCNEKMEEMDKDGKKFQDPVTLKRNTSVVMCGICDQKLQFGDIQEHLQTHLEKKVKTGKGLEMLSCIICTKIIQKKDLDTHLKCHSIPELAATKFIMNQYRVLPEMIHEEGYGASLKNFSMKEDVKIFLCNLCNQGYDTCAKLAEHVEKHLAPMLVGKQESPVEEEKRGRKRKGVMIREPKDAKNFKGEGNELENITEINAWNQKSDLEKQFPIVLSDTDLKKNSILAAALNSAPKYASSLPRTIIVTKTKETPASLLADKPGESGQNQAYKSTVMTVSKDTPPASVVTLSKEGPGISRKSKELGAVTSGTTAGNAGNLKYPLVIVKPNSESGTAKPDSAESANLATNMLPGGKALSGQTVPVMLIRQDNQDIKYVPASSLANLHPELKAALNTGQLVKIVMPSGESGTRPKVAQLSANQISGISVSPSSDVAVSSAKFSVSRSIPVPVHLVSNISSKVVTTPQIKSTETASETNIPAASLTVLGNSTPDILQMVDTKQKQTVTQTFISPGSEVKFSTSHTLTPVIQGGQIKCASNDPSLAQLQQQLVLLKPSDTKVGFAPGVSYQLAKTPGQIGHTPLSQAASPSIIPINLQTPVSGTSSVCTVLGQQPSASTTTLVNTSVHQQQPVIAKQQVIPGQQELSSIQMALTNAQLQQSLSSSNNSSGITNQATQLQSSLVSLMLSRLAQPQFFMPQSSAAAVTGVQSQLSSSQSNIVAGTTSFLPQNPVDPNPGVPSASSHSQKPTFNLVFAPSLSIPSVQQSVSATTTTSTTSTGGAQASLMTNIPGSLPTQVACLRLICNSCNQDLSSLELMGKHVCSKVATALQPNLVSLVNAQTNVPSSQTNLVSTQSNVDSSQSISPQNTGSKIAVKKITIYPCTKCKATFTDFTKFSEHVNNHGLAVDEHQAQKPLQSTALNRKFACALCPRMFFKEKEWSDHVSDVHSERTRYCMYCNRKLTSQLNYDLHLMVNHNIECLICKFRLKWDTELVKHSKKHMKMTDNMMDRHTGYQCEKCHICFRTRKVCMTHFRLCHAEETNEESFLNHWCTICDLAFCSWPVLVKHLLETHYRPKVYHCGVCQPGEMVELKSKGDIGLHMHNHEDTPNLSFCHECLLVFPTSTLLEEHIAGLEHEKHVCGSMEIAESTKSRLKSVIQDKQKSNVEEDMHGSEDDTGIQKDESEKKIMLRLSRKRRVLNKSSLRKKIVKDNHATRDHNPEQNLSDLECKNEGVTDEACPPTELICSICGQGNFKSGYQLKQHKIMRHVCPRSRTTTYFQHLMNKRAKLFECTICYKRFDLQITWLGHMRAHKNYKMFACDAPDCRMKFTTKRGLQSHHANCSSKMRNNDDNDYHYILTTGEEYESHNGSKITLDVPGGSSLKLPSSSDTSRVDNSTAGHLSVLYPTGNTLPDTDNDVQISASGPFLCKLCSQECESVSDLKHHLFTRHSHQFLECSKCRSVYLTSSDFASHRLECNKSEQDGPADSKSYLSAVKKVTRKKLYGCSLCQKTFFKLMKLTKHVWEHEQLEQKKTKGAKFSKSQSAAASRNLRSLTETQADGNVAINVKEEEAEGKYMCSICKIVFRESADLFQHSKSHLDASELASMARNKLKYAQSVTGDPTKIPSTETEILLESRDEAQDEPEVLDAVTESSGGKLDNLGSDSRTMHGHLCSDCNKFIVYEGDKLCEMVINHSCNVNKDGQKEERR